MVRVLALRSKSCWYDPRLLQPFGWDYKPRSRLHDLIVSGMLLNTPPPPRISRTPQHQKLPSAVARLHHSPGQFAWSCTCVSKMRGKVMVFFLHIVAAWMMLWSYPVKVLLNSFSETRVHGRHGPCYTRHSERWVLLMYTQLHVTRFFHDNFCYFSVEACL